MIENAFVIGMVIATAKHKERKHFMVVSCLCIGQSNCGILLRELKFVRKRRKNWLLIIPWHGERLLPDVLFRGTSSHDSSESDWTVE